MSASLSRPFAFPTTASPNAYGMTSGATQVSAPGNLTCAIFLIASGITNAAPRLETIETLHQKNDGARQITSAHSHWRLLLQESTVAQSPPGAGSATNAEAIAELRRLTGFTWDQVARLFSVSRRSVHLWASGQIMSSDNEEHLHRMLGALASGSGVNRNRAALLSFDPKSNLCVFDMLTQGDYDGVSRALGTSTENSLANGRQLVPSSMTLQQRLPTSPAVLMAARQDDRPLSPRRARAVNYRRSARDV